MVLIVRLFVELCWTQTKAKYEWAQITGTQSKRWNSKWKIRKKVCIVSIVWFIFFLSLYHCVFIHFIAVFLTINLLLETFVSRQKPHLGVYIYIWCKTITKRLDVSCSHRKATRYETIRTHCFTIIHNISLSIFFLSFAFFRNCLLLFIILQHSIHFRIFRRHFYRSIDLR